MNTFLPAIVGALESTEPSASIQDMEVALLVELPAEHSRLPGFDPRPVETGAVEHMRACVLSVQSPLVVSD